MILQLELYRPANTREWCEEKRRQRELESIARMGQCWQEMIEDRSTAILHAKQVADRLNAEFPDHPITWRELLTISKTQEESNAPEGE